MTFIIWDCTAVMGPLICVSDIPGRCCIRSAITVVPHLNCPLIGEFRLLLQYCSDMERFTSGVHSPRLYFARQKTPFFAILILTLIKWTMFVDREARTRRPTEAPNGEWCTMGSCGPASDTKLQAYHVHA